MNLLLAIFITISISTICNGASFDLNIENDLNYPMTLKWYNFKGGLTKYSEIEAGETIYQQTYTTHKWLLENPSWKDQRIFTAGDYPFDRDGAYIKISTIKGPEPVKWTTTPSPIPVYKWTTTPSPASKKYQLIIKNDLPYSMVLKTMSNGRLIILGRIFPGGQISRKTFFGTKFLVSNQGDIRKFKAGYGTFKSNRVVRISEIGEAAYIKISTIKGPEPVYKWTTTPSPVSKKYQLLIKNDLPYRMTLKKKTKGGLINLQLIFPGGQISRKTFFGTKFLVSNLNGDTRKFKAGFGTFKSNRVVKISEIGSNKNVNPKPQVNTTPRPTLTTPRPTLTTPRPTLTTPRPIFTTPRPIFTTPRPILTTPRPIFTTPRPIFTTPRPIFTTPRPILSTPKPPINSEIFLLVIKNDLPYEMFLKKLVSNFLMIDQISISISNGDLVNLQKISPGSIISQDTFVGEKLLLENKRNGDQRKFKAGFGSFEQNSFLVSISEVEKTQKRSSRNGGPLWNL